LSDMLKGKQAGSARTCGQTCDYSGRSCNCYRA
jgi:hypothetical protein